MRKNILELVRCGVVVSPSIVAYVKVVDLQASQQDEIEEVGDTIDRDGNNDNNKNYEIDSLLKQASQQYKSKEVSSTGKQDDDIICERDHHTRFVTPVTNEVLEEVMKDGIPQKN